MSRLRNSRKYFSIFIFLFFCIFQNLHAQVQTAKPGVSMIANSGGYYEYLPQGYSATGTTTYPLIIMLHGIGELGDGSATSLPMVLRNGVPALINAGTFPTSINYNGQDFKFIVVTPQFKAWPSAADIGGVISYCQSHYKVDASRIYLTGISMGGGALWTAISDPTIAPKVAAAVVFAGAYSPYQTKADVIADNNIGVWALHNDKDPTVASSNTINWISEIRTRKATAPVKKSIFSGTSHNCWANVYPVTYKENGINIYQFMLMFQKGATVPVLPVNKPPVANGGGDKTVLLPTSSATLSGSGTDSDNGISSYGWTKISGPAATISTPATAVTSISGLTAGTYVFRLTVTDKELATGTNDVTVTVSGSSSSTTTSTSTPTTTTTTTAPKPTTFYASAGADQTITLPTNSVNVTGKATDVGGTISKYKWSLVSGPSQYTIKDSTAASTTISNLTTGSYTFRLTVYDASGVTTSDAMVVTVNGSSSSTGTVTAPKPTTFYASAGADQTITLPTNSVTVSGKATDVGGTISQYKWSKVSGPSQYSFKDSTAASTVISNLTSGSYTFRLTVTDLSGVVTSDAMIVNVTGTASTSTASTGTVTAPKPTTFYASAGPDVSLVLPVDSVALNGKATDVGGTITKYVWSKISGPAQYKFTDSTKATTKIMGLVEGTYTFRLMVYDASGVYTSDAVDIKVSLTGTTAAVNTATTASSLQVAQSSVNINPEKVTDKFILSVNNDQTGTMKVQLINTAGTSAKTYLLQKPAAGAIQSYLSVGDVPSGNYTVQVEVGSYSASTVLVKL